MKKTISKKTKGVWVLPPSPYDIIRMKRDRLVEKTRRELRLSISDALKIEAYNDVLNEERDTHIEPDEDE